MATISDATVIDLRFPTSRNLDGSDAMNPDPDYSAAYLRLATSDPGVAGHGFVFTIGRGNDIQAAAVDAVARRLVGRDVDALVEDPGAVNRELTWDSQLRWLGPDKGVMHMAIGAVMSAVWDLRARREGRPLWSALAALEPVEIVDLVDWTYIADFLDPGRAREILEERRPLRDARIDKFRRDGLAAYATTPGWLGYSDEKLVRLCHEAVADGFTTIKLKVGADISDDRRRLGLAREAVGPDVAIAVDANQRWNVPEAIAAINALREFDLRWVEEPTHPDDVVGHATIAEAVRPVPIATGEMLASPHPRQAADPVGRGADPAGRRHPHGRGARPAGRHHHGRRRRGGGHPPRRWGGSVRGRPALRLLQRHLRSRRHSGPVPGVRRPPARAPDRPRPRSPPAATNSPADPAPAQSSSPAPS